MTVTRFSKAKTIPKVSTEKSAPTTTNFAKGIFTYKPNDLMDYDEIYLAQNARFDRIGEYATRRGLKPLCEPIGKNKVFDNYSDDYKMVDISFISIADFIDNPVYSITVKLATTDPFEYGHVEAVLWYNNNEFYTSCAELHPDITIPPVDPDDPYTTPEDVTFTFKDLPNGLATFYLRQQGKTFSDKSPYRMAVTGAPHYTSIMRKVYGATPGQVVGLFEANIEGIKTILFAFKEDEIGTTTLYRMDEDGTTSAIRELPAGVEKVRFLQNMNLIRYADGQEGPRLLDPSDWSDTAIPTTDLKTDVDLNIKVSNIMDGTQDNIMYFDADTTTQAVWTYPYGTQYAAEAKFTTTATLNKYTPDATTTTTIETSTLTPVSDTYPLSSLTVGDLILDDMGTYGKVSSVSGSNVVVESISHIAEPINTYDKFDRDFRQNFPAIGTGDPLTAMFNLGGVIYFLTRRNKYYMYTQTADVWTQQTSSAQHGTFSQESVVCDLNYAYYANDDGVYIFDGSSEASITEKTIQRTYDAIKGKESIALELYNNRLYVFYSSKGNGKNDACLVYNINLRLWESFDTGLPVASTIGRQTVSNRFICGSSTTGQLYLFEDNSNEYADLGAPINFDLETSYLHFGTPSQLHRITKWRPEFATTDKPYTIKCGYALDFTDDVRYAFSINLKYQIPVYENDGWGEWTNPPDYGNPVTPTKLTTIPKVYNQFRRCQIRYRHHAAFEPVNFKSHTLTVQTERIR